MDVVRPPEALYVHVPFCISHCPYCDFVVYSGAAARGPRDRWASFLAALHAEIELRAQALDAPFGGSRPPLASVYLGGGTPSLLPARSVATLLEHVARRLGIAPGAEVTLEANPGPSELGDLRGFRTAGVDRLSLGAQSLVDAEIRALGRRHSAADVAAAVRAARSAGFDRVSLDLLYDIPGQTVETWEASVSGAIALGADHVSAYALSLDDPDAEGLTAEGGDHLPLRTGARAWRARARRGQDDARAARMYQLADELLGAAGLRWYEISNWARPGHESRHNRAYWERRPHEAVGPGAHAFDGALRRWNAARLDRYVAALTPGDGVAPRLPPGGFERLDPSVARAETAILALRTRDGVHESRAAPSARVALDWAVRHGLAERSGDRVTLTLRGRLLADEVFVRIIADAPAAAA